MNIVGVRIDGRLVHGQVANLWANRLNVDRIMIPDAKVAQNDMEKTGQRLSTPAGIKLSIIPEEQAAEQLLAERYGNQRLFIVVKKPAPLLKLLELGVPIEEINVGNMSQTDETRSLAQSINVTPEDEEIFQKILEQGVKLVHQMVPNDSKEDFQAMLKK